jgi:hypothetical protein
MAKRLDLLTGKFIEETLKKSNSPEAAVGRTVDAFLKTLGAYVRQINSGGIIRGSKWTISGQGSGIADRLAWLPDGKFIAIELKAPGKKKTVSDAQYAFLQSLISRGHKACVADCVEDVKLALSQTQQELVITLDNLKTISHPRRPSPEPMPWE